MIDMTLTTDVQQESVKTIPVKVILVVEDDEATREMLIACIEEEKSYRVLSLESGEETLRRLEEIKEVKPMLFILDLHLSGMTAFDLYDHLHSQNEFDDVPATILTASTPNLEIDSAITERGLDMLLKPFDIDDLLRCIEQARTRSTHPI
ncbi:MAG: response regulator [Ktedonobacteraceae bacterium]